jgi:surfactin synthase thioesterase subunit
VEEWRTGMSTQGRWLQRLKSSSSPVRRLLAIPFAGGAASAFRPWIKLLPAEWELVAVQLPGREGRFQEPHCRSAIQAVDGLADELAASASIPTVLFGHSMGAALALELARRWKAVTSSPLVGAVFSGCNPPGGPFPLNARLAPLPDPEFVATLRSLQRAAHPILDDDALLGVFLPLIRADIVLAETHRLVDPRPLDCPVAVAFGDEDSDIDPKRMEGWSVFSPVPLTVRSFPGDHFFPFGNANGTGQKDFVQWLTQVF